MSIHGRLYPGYNCTHSLPLPGIRLFAKQADYQYGFITDGLPVAAEADDSFHYRESSPWPAKTVPLNLCN